MQVIDEPTRGHAVLDLLHMNKEELIEDVKVDDCLGHGWLSDYGQKGPGKLFYLPW